MELRAYHLVPAVEYLQANACASASWSRPTRRSAKSTSWSLPHGVWWHPSQGLNALTSFTGHPGVSVLIGLRSNGQPLAVTLAGHLYREGELLAVAQRLLEATGFADHRPPLFS